MGLITDDCEYVAFCLITGPPELWFFFQQIIHYLLANYVPKIPNDAQIMRIVQYCTIFLSESPQCFNIFKKKKKLANQV